MPMSPQDVAKKWSRNLNAAVPAMKQSILGLTVNPMQKAAQAGDAYIAGVQDAYNNGKWQRGLQNADFNEWKEKTANIGTQRVAAGATAAESRMGNFFGQLLPHCENVKAQIRAMPKGTREERIQRMLRNVDLMSQFKFKAR